MRITIIILLLAAYTSSAQNFKLETITTKTNAYFRGMSVVNDNIAWVSGSQGVVGRSIDGGKTWRFLQVRGHEKLEFRSLYAFDSLNALIANAGSPAYIMKTVDGGRNWKTVFQNSHPQAFIDGVDFWNNKEGMVYGDVIEGSMLIIKTSDGGNTWKEIQSDLSPKLMEGEGSFAASGTNIRCIGKSDVIIATGGKHSRLFTSGDKGKTWQILQAPIIQGETMTGIFSIAFRDRNHGIIVGGNYEIDSLKKDHVLLTHDGGKTWSAPDTATRGIRECVEYINNSVVLAVGFPGIDISYDGGKNWKALSNEKQFAVIRKARSGGLTLLAGGGGRLALLKQ
jgi:photosystem II stability/assembly factor-like uncharacterized protein